jgi:phosphoribosylformimino-5-aminoimidazole carboxamide ribotide isomerase
MIIYPAIDLLEGQVVRLRQGERHRCTVYSSDPAAFALEWKQAGAEWLHVVDLDGAFTGTPQNLTHVTAIAKAAGIPIQLGGGMRHIKNIHKAICAGVSRVVLGTKACESIDFVREAIDTFGPEKIAVGIDARNGNVAVEGWTKASSWEALTLAQAISVAGARTIIYTDIATDGMFAGPNIPALQALLAETDLDVIASGGVGSLADIEALQRLPKLHGVIIGKALYDKKIDLQKAIAQAASQSPS